MNLEPKLIELLNKRGLNTQEEIDEFLSDKPQKTYDPFLLHNMEEGVDLILSTIDNGEKICIYGDYDADGITSTAILMEVLSNLTDNLDYYIPSRFKEGYGLNRKAIDKIKAEGVDLIITVDCGCVACDEVEYAKGLGLKVLVTDHHTVSDKIADCIVIDPKQPECNYPCEYLAGCGVAFKLAQAIINTVGLPKSVLTRTLDLVGIGTIGDIVPLLDENRTLAKFGIRAINTSARESIKELVEGVSLKNGHVNAENVSFVIVPHLNAAGRMKDAKMAVELLRSKDPEKMSEGVGQLIECNNLRKQLQGTTYEECRNIVEEKYRDSSFILIELEDAHEGITGIVAGKIKDTYNKPTVIVTPTADQCYKGTGRSIEGVNIYQLLKENESLFERFGGHNAACGFTISRDNIEELRLQLNRSMDKIIEEKPDILKRHIKGELVLRGEDVNMELAAQLEKLEPCGAANPRPFLQVEVTVSAFGKMGNQNQYTRFTAILDNGKELPCVCWNRTESFDHMLQNGQKVSIIGTLGSKLWNGRKSLQFTVESVEK